MADNTIALQAVPPKFDPLATIQGLNTAQQGILTNKLLGQEVAGKIAKGKAFQAAINAETGAFDPVAAMKNLGSSEDGAQFAGEFAEQVQKIKTATAQGKGAEIDALGKKLDFAANWTLGLLANEKTQPITPEVFKEKFTAELLPSGLYTSKEDQAEIGAMYAQMGPDPRRNAEVLKAFVQRAKPTTMAIELTRGPITMQETGPAIVPTRVNPNTMEVQTGTPIMKGLTPGEKTDSVTIYGADEKPYAVSKGQIYDAYGNLKEGTGAGGGGGGAGGDGRYPGAPRGAIGPTANAPGVEDSAIRDSATFHATADRVANFAADEQAIRGAINALEGAKTGKGGQPIQDWRSLLLTMGAKLGKEDEQAAVDYAKAGKYLAAIAKQAGTDAAMNTDAARALVQEANPSLETVNRAAREMLPIILGQRRMDAALVAAADAAGINSRNPRGISDFKAKWGRDNDPAAFSADLIPAAERRKYIDALKTDAAKARYVAGLRAAIDAGMFTRADLAK